MTKALVPNILVLLAFWILTLLSLKADRNMISGRGLREWTLDLGGLVFQGVLVPLIQMFVLFKLLSIAIPAAQGSLALAPALAFLLNFVAVDYAYYWNHRLLHHKALWPAHAVHHSIEHLDPVATSRNTIWTPVLIVYLWLNGLGLFLLKDPFWFLLGAAATAALDLWRHSFDLAPPASSRAMTWISKILITPKDHAWHHSQTHADLNFGANLNIWDRLHGTYSHRIEHPEKLGIATGMSFTEEALNPYRLERDTAAMSKLGRVMALFPLAIMILTVGSLFLSFTRGSLPLLFGAFAFLYLLPPLAFRLHNRLFPLETGMSKLSGGKYSPWWGGHQTQLIFLAAPLLESLLRIIPGAYSAWLRLWGSRVGKCVYWTPQIEITDRSLLEIGDHVIFGHKAAFYNHVANPRKDNILLFVQKTKIGDGVFIGAGSRIGPGATIEDGVKLPILTDVHVNQRITAEMKFDPREKTNSVEDERKYWEPATAAEASGSQVSGSQVLGSQEVGNGQEETGSQIIGVEQVEASPEKLPKNSVETVTGAEFDPLSRNTIADSKMSAESRFAIELIDDSEPRYSASPWIDPELMEAPSLPGIESEPDSIGKTEALFETELAAETAIRTNCTPMPDAPATTNRSSFRLNDSLDRESLVPPSMDPNNSKVIESPQIRVPRFQPRSNEPTSKRPVFKIKP